MCGNFTKCMPASYQSLYKDLRNFKEIQVCFISIGVVRNIALAIGECSEKYLQFANPVNIKKGIDKTVNVLVAAEAMSKVEKIMLIFDPGGVMDEDVKGMLRGLCLSFMKKWLTKRRSRERK